MSIFFVAGATGYAGKAVVQELCSRGIPCVAHIRPQSKDLEAKQAELEGLGATVAVCEWQLDSITALLAEHEPTHIVSALGITKAGAKREARRLTVAPTYESVDRDLSLMLHAAASLMYQPPLFVFVSSMGADGAQNRYIRARHDVETAIQAAELPYLIARPAFLTGSDRSESRPLERGAAIFSDVIFSALGAIGLGKLRAQYASLSAGELAWSLVHHALSDSENLILPPEQLRRHDLDTTA